MKTPPKMYDFPFEKVKTQVAQTFRKASRQATVADVIAATGLPKFQVESVLPTLVAECHGALRVTESGEILYAFPQGVVNRETGWRARGRRWARQALKTLATGLSLAFKVWILLMLVGYFVLFVVLMVAAVVISIAVSVAKRDGEREDSGGGILGFYLAGRVFEFFLLLWLYSGDASQRTRQQKKPFYKAIFEFVFGLPSTEAARQQQERRALVAWIRQNRGVLTLEDVIRLTGLSYQEAQTEVNRLMLAYEGQPQVSEAGSLYFFFPELLRTVDPLSVSQPPLGEQPLIAFSHNPASTQRWIVFLNGFNLVFGGYFVSCASQGFTALQQQSDPLSFLYLVALYLVGRGGGVTLAQAEAGLFWGLGIVPLVYSALFFGIPLVRRWWEKRQNQRIQRRNFRRKLVRVVLNRPEEIQLQTIEPDGPQNAIGKAGAEREAIKEALLRDVATDYPLEVDGAGPPYIYRIPELQRKAQDVAQVRAQIDVQKYAVGAVIFDTEQPVK